MPVYGLGTWRMGGELERDTKNDDARDIASIQSAIELGVTHIDTAESYANGYTETLLGQAIEPYDRSSLFLVSKVRAMHMAYVDVLKAAEASLHRLKTDYLDLYLLHRYNPDIPLRETFRALDELVQQGRVRNIGVSNFPAEKLREAQFLTKNKIVCNQVHYNLKYREAERRGILQYCLENNVMLVAWRPLQMGGLFNDSIEILHELSKKYAKTPTQIAINWLSSQDNVVVLAKTTKREHLQENLGGVGWSMEHQDVQRLRQEFPGQEEVSDAVPLPHAKE